MAYWTREHGPGKCRNGHDKDYPGDCVVCAAAKRARRNDARRGRRPVPKDLTFTEADVLADVAAMRARVAARRLRAARRRALGVAA